MLLDAEGDPIALSGDFPESIEHRSGWDQGNATWSTILERVAYIRGEVGQPTRVSWSDGGFLNIGYTAAEGLKITSETYGVGAQAIDTGIYGYSANGSRITEVVNGVPFSYNYGAGFQLMNIQQGATPVSAFDYDLAGNLKTVSSTVTATYSLADELQSVTRNGITTTYSYDPEGRRIKAVSTTSGQQRKFVVAPTIGTDRDVLHMITDQNDVPKVMYFYAGDQPIMRFEVDAAGNPANPTFYLEDASGSILGLANATGELTTRFRYDGFGNPIGAQADPGNPNYFAASSGGDFRFHGTWLEGDSGLYKMGLRDYDPATGRFLQRDPANADLHDPESFHAYAFAEGNPWYYSDPTGAFSIIEVNAVSAKQISFATFKAGVVNSAKEYGKEQLFAALSEFTLNQLKAIYPPLDSIMNQFKADLSQGVGQYFEQQIMNKVCGGLQDNPVVQSIWFKPQLNNEGSPMGDGFNCRQLPSYKIEKGHFYPDFIISSYPPTDTQKGQDQKLAMLVGDIKLSGNSLYNQYVKPGERNKVGQFNAIASYASDSTYTKASVFIAAFTGQRWKLRQVGQLLGREGLKKGTLAFVIALAKNRNYNEKAPN